jgi:hypothetical protein
MVDFLMEHFSLAPWRVGTRRPPARSRAASG